MKGWPIPVFFDGWALVNWVLHTCLMAVLAAGWRRARHAYRRRRRLIAAESEVCDLLRSLAEAWHRCSKHPDPFDSCVYLYCPERRALLARIYGKEGQQ